MPEVRRQGSARAADGPEEVCVGVLGGCDGFARGEHDFDGEEVVDGQPVLAG